MSAHAWILSCLTHRSWRTTRGVSEEARWSLWWRPAGCSGRRSCRTWPLTLWSLRLDPLAVAAPWNSLWWRRRGSRMCRCSVRHQGELWGFSRLALSWESSLGWQHPPLTPLQEDSGSCRRMGRKRWVRRGRGGWWDGTGCWLQAPRACPVHLQRRWRWADWAAGRCQPAWSPAQSPSRRSRPGQSPVLGEQQVCGASHRPPLLWPPRRDCRSGQSKSGRWHFLAKWCSPLPKDREENSGVIPWRRTEKSRQQ